MMDFCLCFCTQVITGDSELRQILKERQESHESSSNDQTY